MRPGAIVLAWLLLTAGPGGAAGQAWQPSRAEVAAWERQARRVTIYRDTWGVPHVHGRTDADAVFGMAWARAEDRFPETEPAYIQALGRLAEVEGEEGREEYAAASPALRALVDAWAAGTNFYLYRHPEVRPRLPMRYEGWMAFAMYRGFGLTPDAGGVDLRRLARIAQPAPRPDGEGSNMWAVAGAKSASGHPMLFLNPHTPMLPVYEGHWMSDEGWNVSGLTAYSQTLVPVKGFNAHLGWAHTVNSSDMVDAWEEVFDDPARPLAYRHGDGHRLAVEWRDSIRVRTDRGAEVRYLTLRKTHHGPIVGERNGRPVAVMYGNVDRGGLLQQWYAMGKARNLAEFRRALAINGLVHHSVMYADRDGNILFIHAGAVPRRDTTIDWSGFVDGSDPRTDWQGYHTPDEMPQVLNPPAGWMQNTNSTPFLTTAAGANPRREDFPRYIALHPDNWRARASRRLLAGPDPIDFDRWTAMAFDTYFLAADREVPVLVQEWRGLRDVDPARAEVLRPLVEGLERWDRYGRAESAPALWFGAFALEAAAVLRGTDTTTWGRVAALERVRRRLLDDFGSIEVPLGEYFRLQRPRARLGETYSDARPSLPLPGFEANAVGTIFALWGERPAGAKRRFATGGSAYVAVVEFGPTVRARSITPFGQSGDHDSPHFIDQATLFAEGRMKPAWFTMEEIRANLARRYRPGERPRGR
jgi:acyl-homoserine-lactone acylase